MGCRGTNLAENAFILYRFSRGIRLHHSQGPILRKGDSVSCQLTSQYGAAIEITKRRLATSPDQHAASMLGGHGTLSDVLEKQQSNPKSPSWFSSP